MSREGLMAFRRPLAVAALTTLGIALCLLASPAAAADWDGALARYAQSPFHNRRALAPLRRADLAVLSPLEMLALGDASLRARNYGAATRYFEAVATRGPGEPWTGWARIGLAWGALARGDQAEARRYFGLVSATAASPSAALAYHSTTLLDAADGDPGTAERFAKVASDVHVAPELRRTARLGEAYALYWQGEYGSAATAFDAFTSDPAVGALWDDARYGAAWARYRAGDRDGAERALRFLATGPGRRGGPVAPALVDLEPKAVLRAGFERFRRSPMNTPEQQIATVLDGDGYSLAAAALRRLGVARVETAPASERTGHAMAVRVRTAPPSGAPAVPRASARDAIEGLPVGAMSIVALLALLFGVWAWRSLARAVSPVRR